MRLRHKIPFLLLLSAMLSASLLAGLGSIFLSQTLMARVTENLEAVAEARATALLNYVDGVKETALVLGERAAIKDSLGDLTAAWRTISGETHSPDQLLLTLLYQESAGSDTAKQSHGLMQYRDAYERIHPWLSIVREHKGYSDLFLVSPDGEVLYSQAKDATYATNLLTGPWRQTNLARAVVHALEGRPGSFHFSDYENYPPDQNQPAAFFAVPVFADGSTAGVFVIRIPTDRITQVMQVTAGMGETGETYLVGPDGAMRSNSRFSETPTILAQKVATAAVNQALAGQTGTEVLTDYRGVEVLSAYRPINVLGANWVMLAERDMREINAPIRLLIVQMMIGAAGICLLVAGAGVYFARSVWRPLEKLGVAVAQFGENRNVTLPVDRDRRDELGIIARSFTAMRASVLDYIQKTEAAENALRAERQQLARILDASPVGVSIMDQDRRRKYVNARMAEMYGQTPEAMLGDKISEQLMDPQTLNFVRQKMETDGMVRNIEVEMLRNDASNYFALLTMTPITFDGGPCTLIWSYDISAQKIAEQRLKSSQEEFKSILESSPIGVSVLNSKRERIFLNKQFAAITKQPYEALAAGEPILIWQNEEERRQYFDLLDRDGRVEHFEFALRCGDGSVAWALGSGVRLSFSGEQMQINWLVDVTQRKTAEQEIEQQHVMLQGVLKNMDQGVLMMDDDMRMVVANDKLYGMLDVPQERFGPGTPMRDIVTFLAERGEYGPGDIDTLVEARLAHGKISKPHNWDHTRPNGAIFEVRGNPISQRGSVATYTDVTARRRAEEETRNLYELIRDSVNYASNIQRSTLPVPELFNQVFMDHVVIWEPRDVVGGDIYWLVPVGDAYIIGVADCTGHGVPGAFITLVASCAFMYAVARNADGNPAGIIATMNQFIKDVLSQISVDAQSNDGLELGICRIGNDAQELTYAGGRFSLWAIENGSAREYKGNKTGIGYVSVPYELELTTHTVPFSADTSFYMFSDGFNDQIGGERRRGFGKRRVIDVLNAHGDQPMTAQSEALMTAFRDYQAGEARRDDVTLIGFRI